MMKHPKTKAIIAVCLMVALLGQICVWTYAAEDPTGWTTLYSTDFEDGDMPNELYGYFSVYNLKNNYITEGNNSYFEGRFPEGASMYTYDFLENYALDLQFKANMPGSPSTENCYKSAIAVKQDISSPGKTIIEPDNGDSDKSSYLGSNGIFFYAYGNYLEVAVARNADGGTAGPANGAELGLGMSKIVEDASARTYGVYSTGYIFRLPDGVTFDAFTHIRMECEESVIKAYVADTLICTITMSDVKKVTTLYADTYWDASWAGTEAFDGKAYTRASVRDAAGAEVLALDGCVVPETGGMAILCRANTYWVDDLCIQTRSAPPSESETVPETTSETDTDPETEPVTVGSETLPETTSEAVPETESESKPTPSPETSENTADGAETTATQDTAPASTEKTDGCASVMLLPLTALTILTGFGLLDRRKRHD